VTDEASTVVSRDVSVRQLGRGPAISDLDAAEVNYLGYCGRCPITIGFCAQSWRAGFLRPHGL